MTAAATIPNTDITGLGTASTKDAGAALGVATLDSSGKVPVSELPAAVLGALSYQGTWNASTNTPTLTSSTGTKGYYYVVAVAGNTNLDGITDWLVGDWAVYNGTAWQKVDNTDAGGDVVGPSSSTDNAIARFDSTTGKVIQNSTVTINDNGTLEAVNGISFDTTPTSAPTAEGSLSWNLSDGTLDLVMKGGNVVQQIGEEQYYTVRNETGSTIANGTPVMANGVTAGSGRITVTPAIANGSIDELRFIGLTTESITNGINGYVTSFGYVRGLDTRGTPYGETWAEGDVIYVSPTTAGYLTNVEPTAPNLKIVVAIVITRNQTSGVLLVRPTAYPHITHLSDVNISSPTSGNLLIYDAPQNRWENADLTASTGISVTNGAGSVTITNTAPDQTVVLTGGTGISTSGTYPSFTVTNTAPDQTVALASGTGISVTGTYPNFTVTNTAPSSGGTVTSVTGTAPIVSSGGNTPAISIPAATSSVNGYLTSTDWTTFNSKGSGTVTSVGGTGTVSGISLSGTVTSSGNLTLGGTLDLSSPPAIGNTTPNTVAATTITATTSIMPATDNTGVIGDATTTWSNGQFTNLTVDSTMTVTNTLNVRAAIDLADSDVLRMGSSDDWQIFYNGTTNKANVELEAACLAISYTDNGTEIASLEKSTGTYTAKQLTASNGIVTNSKTVSASFTIPATDNASSAGPITIASGVTVTVSSGSRWVVS
jgi:uncharacterized protein YdeI (BOF family)